MLRLNETSIDQPLNIIPVIEEEEIFYDCKEEWEQSSCSFGNSLEDDSNQAVTTLWSTFAEAIKTTVASCVKKCVALFSRTQKIYSSTLGQMAVYSVRENILEGVTYICGGKIVSNYGRNLAKYMMPIGIVYVLGKKIFQVGFSNPQKIVSNMQKCIQIMQVLGVAFCAYQINTFAVEYFKAEEMIDDIGEFAAYFSAGIVCSFLALKAHGSGEVFWEGNKLRTYPVKSLICMAGTAVINYKISIPENIQMITDLMLGSLIFNAEDIYLLSKKMCQGTALRGVIRQQLPLYSVLEQPLLKMGARQIVRSALSSVESSIGTSMDGKIPIVLQSCITKVFVKFISPVIEEYKQIVERQVEMGVENAALSCGVLETPVEIVASTLIMRGFNLYFYLNKFHPEVLSCLKTGATSVQELTMFLQTTLLHKKVFLNELVCGGEPLSSTDKNMMEFLQLIQIPKMAFLEQSDEIAENLVQAIANVEEQTCGVSFSGEREKIKIKELVEIHLKGMLVCALVCMPSIVVPLISSEIDQFHSSILGFLPNYYSRMMGSSNSSRIGNFLSTQVAADE